MGEREVDKGGEWRRERWIKEDSRRERGGERKRCRGREVERGSISGRGRHGERKRKRKREI